MQRSKNSEALHRERLQREVNSGDRGEKSAPWRATRVRAELGELLKYLSRRLLNVYRHIHTHRESGQKRGED